MQFNPDITKQAVQVIFSQKRDKPIHLCIYFNKSEVVSKPEQKHLGRLKLELPKPCEREDCECKKGNFCY